MSGDDEKARDPRLGRPAAVTDAEVRLLEHELAPYGVLSKGELERRTDARFWHEGRFDAVLRAAVERGTIKALPGDMLALQEDHVDGRLHRAQRSSEPEAS